MVKQVSLKILKLMCLAALMALVSYPVFAKAETFRATQLNSEVWQKLQGGGSGEWVVEFRQGDVLPLTVNMGGDLLETTESHPSYITVKKSFYVKVVHDRVLLSLDGVEYKPIRELLRGNINAGAGLDPNGGPANAINVLMQAFLK